MLIIFHCCWGCLRKVIIMVILWPYVLALCYIVICFVPTWCAVRTGEQVLMISESSTEKNSCQVFISHSAHTQLLQQASTLRLDLFLQQALMKQSPALCRKAPQNAEDCCLLSPRRPQSFTGQQSWMQSEAVGAEPASLEEHVALARHHFWRLSNEKTREKSKNVICDTSKNVDKKMDLIKSPCFHTVFLKHGSKILHSYYLRREIFHDCMSAVTLIKALMANMSSNKTSWERMMVFVLQAFARRRCIQISSSDMKWKASTWCYITQTGARGCYPSVRAGFMSVCHWKKLTCVLEAGWNALNAQEAGRMLQTRPSARSFC